MKKREKKMEKKICIIIIILCLSGTFSSAVMGMSQTEKTGDLSENTDILQNRCAFSSNCSSCVINSPMIIVDIPYSGTANVKFSTRYEILPVGGQDYGYVKMSDDRGKTWRTMCTLQGSVNEWVDVDFDLYQWVGEVWFLFEYFTFSAFSISRGMYIDNIFIEGISNGEPVTLYHQEFEDYGIGQKWGSWVISKIPEEDDETPPETEIVEGPDGKIGYNSVSFGWIGIDNVHGTPEWDLIYSYILEGYDNEWSSWTLSTNQIYNNLPDGEYTFKVKAKDLDNNIDPSPATRSFIVDTTDDTDPPIITITRPRPRHLYIADMIETSPAPATIIIGKITTTVDAYDEKSRVTRVEFYVDDDLKYVDDSPPYEWQWDETVFWRHTLKTVAYDTSQNSAVDEISVIISNRK